MEQSGRYSVRHVGTEQAFRALEVAWNDLLSRSEDKNPFLTFSWQWSWWESYARRGTDELIIVVVAEPESGRVIGIGPWMVRRKNGVRVLQFIGTGRSDYLGWIGSEDDPNAAQVLLDYLWRVRRLWDVCFLSNVLPRQLMRLRCVGWGKMARMRSRIYEYAPYLPIEMPFADYLKGKNKSFRKNIRRYDLEQMEDRNDYRLERLVIDSANGMATVDLFAEIERKSWKYAAGTSHLSAEADRRFWSVLMPRFEKDGWLSSWLLFHHQKPAAFIIGLRYGNKMYTHTSAYDEKSAGAGNIVRNNLIKSAFGEGLAEFDFLCGDEAYKLSWTDKHREVYQVLLARRGLRGSLYYLAVTARWLLAKSRVLKRIRLGFKKAVMSRTGTRQQE